MAGPSVSKRLPVPVFLTTSAGVDASDTTNNANKVTLATALAGEDVVKPHHERYRRQECAWVSPHPDV